MMRHQHSDIVETLLNGFMLIDARLIEKWKLIAACFGHLAALFFKPSWCELKMTKVVIPDSYIWSSLVENDEEKWSIWFAPELHACSWGEVDLALWPFPCGHCGRLIYKLFSGHLPYSRHHGSWAGLSPLLMRGIAEAEVGRHLCDVTWEGAFDGTINRPLQTGAERSLCLLCTCQQAAVATWKNAVKWNGETGL